jgi:DNA-binding response OmpR family regulator
LEWPVKSGLVRCGRALRILVLEAQSAAPYIAAMVAALGGEVVEGRLRGGTGSPLAGLERPDAALIDADAIGTADAVRAARRVRDRYRTPVVFVTARSDGAALHEILEISPHVLFKPVVASELGKLVRRVCEGLNRL